MSIGQRNERSYYDQADRVHSSGRNVSHFIQISLPSTRIEVMKKQVLYTPDVNGEMQLIYAESIQPQHLLYMMRDGKKVTERVMEVKEVQYSLSQSEVQDGMIIVNNVLMRHK